MFSRYIFLFLFITLSISAFSPSQTHFAHTLDLILDYAKAEPSRTSSIYINSNVLRIATLGDKFKEIREKVEREHGKIVMLFKHELKRDNVPFKMKYYAQVPNKIFIFCDNDKIEIALDGLYGKVSETKEENQKQYEFDFNIEP